MNSMGSELTGKNLKNYKIISHLGQGGMATVYKAHELSLNRIVALKVLSSQLTEDLSYIKRFQREAQAAARLNHPNIVQIYSIGEENGIYYFAMEYIKGKSLAQIREENKVIQPENAIHFIIQVAEALAEAHKVGLVHRDIKPSNIMIDSSNRVKVTDFGIAFITHAKTKLTKDGSIIGTPEYLSPEQCEGKTVDQRSDIYSLGVTLYELLSGKTPYEADTPVSMLMKIVKGEFPSLKEVNSRLPNPLIDIVEKMMKKDIQERYQQMEDVIDDLSAFKNNYNQPPTMITEKPKIEKEFYTIESRKNKLRSAIIVAAIIIILMGGAFAAKMFILDKNPSSPSPLSNLETNSSTPSSNNSTFNEIAGDSDIKKKTSNTETGTDNSHTYQEKNQQSISEKKGTLSDSDNLLKGQGSTLPVSSNKKNKKIISAIDPKKMETSDNSKKSQLNSHSFKKTKKLSSIVSQPPKKSCIITLVGDKDKGNLITSFIEEILSNRKYTIVDDPYISGKKLADIAKNRLVIDVRHSGTTDLNYYGNSSQLYSLLVSIKAISLETGNTIAGPINKTIEYTAINANEKIRQAVLEMLSSFLYRLESYDYR